MEISIEANKAIGYFCNNKPYEKSDLTSEARINFIEETLKQYETNKGGVLDDIKSKDLNRKINILYDMNLNIFSLRYKKNMKNHSKDIGKLLRKVGELEKILFTEEEQKSVKFKEYKEETKIIKMKEKFNSGNVSKEYKVLPLKITSTNSKDKSDTEKKQEDSFILGREFSVICQEGYTDKSTCKAPESRLSGIFGILLLYIESHDKIISKDLNERIDFMNNIRTNIPLLRSREDMSPYGNKIDEVSEEVDILEEMIFTKEEMETEEFKKYRNITTNYSENKEFRETKINISNDTYSKLISLDKKHLASLNQISSGDNKQEEGFTYETIVCETTGEVVESKTPINNKTNEAKKDNSRS